MNYRFGLLVLVVWLSASQIPLTAHHSIAASYDASKAMTLTGKVREVRWGNPHTLLSIDVTGSDGKFVIWKIEMGGPAVVFKPGFQKEEIFSGPISLQVWPARDGSKKAAARLLTFSDGRQFDVHDTFAEDLGKK